jgi:zinc transporter, ZIP family
LSTWKILLLGAIAGVTIFAGLPFGRYRSSSPALRCALSALATGILVFLFWDVTTNGVDPIEARIEAHHWVAFGSYAALLCLGFALGYMGLVYYDHWMSSEARVPSSARHSWLRSRPAGARLAILIATGIGLHNFGEGLAIGQSAAAGEIGLAVVLIIGFGLHNTTEGFGIVGPLSGDAELPSWGFLAAMGLIGGGPTFVGTVVGQAWVSPALAVLFFSAAGGSILYVVIQLFEVMRRFATPRLVGWMLLLGMLLGFATDWVLVAAGV